MENKILTMEIKANIDCHLGKPSSRHGYVMCSSNKVLNGVRCRLNNDIELHCSTCLTCGENQYKATSYNINEVNENE